MDDEVVPDDGWGDDVDELDLDFDDDDDAGDGGAAAAVAAPPTAAAPAAAGWEAQKSYPAATAVSPSPLPPDDEGWGDDELDLDSDSDDVDGGGDKKENEQQEKQQVQGCGTITTSLTAAPPLPLEQQLTGESGAAGDGWGEDWDFDEDDVPEEEEEEKEYVEEPKPEHVEEQAAQDGWDDELAFDDDDEDDAALSSPQPQQQRFVVPPPERQMSNYQHKLSQDLESYVLSLPRLSSSIQAVLEAEYNTPEKALELFDYYVQRPGLTRYTLEKELPRMEYSLYENGRHVTDDKAEIARRMYQLAEADEQQQQRQQFPGPPCVLPRCANQSLVADLLQVCTGPDRLIRPQFMATAAADACRFRLHLSPQYVVQAQSHLSLSLPTDRGRWKVADVLVEVLFVCGSPDQPPYVEFRVVGVQLATGPDHPEWRSQLDGVAEMVSHIHPEDDGAFGESPFQQQQQQMNFRDAFLEQTQSISVATVQGMHSAWKEFDSVAGLSKKLGGMPGFLPDDVLQAAADVTHNHSPIPQQQRPSSILGGFFRSGITKLAQKVTLPDENPGLYQQWNDPSRRHSRESQGATSAFEQGTFPRPEVGLASQQQEPSISQQHQQGPNRHSPSAAPAEIPKLYRDETARAAEPDGVRRSSAPNALPTQQQGAIPKFYRTEEDIRRDSAPPRVEDSTVPHAETPGTVPSDSSPDGLEGPVVQDGWGDDIDGLSDPAVDDGWDDEDIDELIESKESDSKGVDDGVEAPIRPAIDGLANYGRDTKITPSRAEPMRSPTTRDESSPQPLPSTKQWSPPRRTHTAADGENLLLLEELAIAHNWTYDPDTDIIPTRIRWTNPRPGSRRIRG